MIKKYKYLCLVLAFSLLAISFLAAGCSSKPSGTFTATGLLGIKTSVSFSGDTVDIQTPLGGREVYKYEIRNNGTEMILTDVSNDTSKIVSYKYIKDPACVVLNGTAYYK